jgi:hypothetical protein
VVRPVTRMTRRKSIHKRRERKCGRALQVLGYTKAEVAAAVGGGAPAAVRRPQVLRLPLQAESDPVSALIVTHPGGLIMAQVLLFFLSNHRSHCVQGRKCVCCIYVTIHDSACLALVA